MLYIPYISLCFKGEIRQVVLKGDDHALAQMIRDREVPAKLHDGLTPLIFAAISGHTIIVWGPKIFLLSEHNLLDLFI
jgi:hypothetical protein